MNGPKMYEYAKQLTILFDAYLKIGQQYVKRCADAQKGFSAQIQECLPKEKSLKSPSPHELWQSWNAYWKDSVQRSILFWDTLRQRGNNWIDHEKAGKPPVLFFDYEIIMDGRSLERPVNYALLRIIPPRGSVINNSKRPFVIIDPRAGHGPGIGGFKEDSEIGVALRAGHPVYFISFFPMPVKGQKLTDVTAAEVHFLKIIIESHPDSPKPVLVGNCQGGWAAMLLAATAPELTGAVVINGAPMSYWGGSDGKNPMRYAGGLLGGSWTSRFASDIGDGIFDGAYLVGNFENLNPANSFWDKYYHVYANIDTEAPRFLEFEKWWGGFYLMNEGEITWIVENLFVGNKLTRGEVKREQGSYFDLKAIRAPIIVFASLGDNITPPEQAFNWVADTYSSTEEVKADGQVIVGLMHQSIGHLGIFVSGQVAKKEHNEIVGILEYIYLLPPGLYGMEIQDTAETGKTKYDVSLKEKRLEELKQLDKDGRIDEKPFEAVEAVSELNEKIYSLCWRPVVRAITNDRTAYLGRICHPLRMQRWAFSNLNPLLWPMPALASFVSQSRLPASKENTFRKAENTYSRAMSASLDLYRDMRDAWGEMLFFQIYVPMIIFDVVENTKDFAFQKTASPRDIPVVKEALAAIERGGYAEALARIGELLHRGEGEIPLYRLEHADKWIKKDKLFSSLPDNDVRRIRTEQAIIVDLEPQQALETLPYLLSGKQDRERVLELLERFSSEANLTEQQERILQMVHTVLDGRAG